MPYTEKMMIHVLQRLQLELDGGAVPNEKFQPNGDDERECYFMAIRANYITIDINHRPILFNDSGRLELDRLLQKKEQERRNSQIYWLIWGTFFAALVPSVQLLVGFVRWVFQF